MTLKEEVAGKNANYCYAPEDKRYTAKGNVILEETDPNPENIKIRARYGKCVYDSKRKVYRISKGAILEAQPTKGSGYNQTNVSQPLYGEGRWSFVMERRQKNGELQARSKKTEISYEVDEEAPSAEVRLNGKKQKQLFTSDFCVCSAENVQDDTEGEVQIQWYLAREKLDDGQITQKQGEWREGKQIEIQEEGIWYPYVKLTDAFGNARYLPVGKVVIDRTSPEIVIQGMPQNQILLSDYKVKISLEEFYLNQKKSYIKLYKRTGRSAKEEQLLDMPVNWKKGKAELKDKKSSGSNTGESGDDVYLKDGWYRLKIYAEDLAGNRKEQEICFAVNRSGPKLTTDASMQKFLKQKTAQQGQKLKFRVWDVNKMQKEELQCIFDGKARNLEEGKDYQKKYRPTAEGFTEYDYEVSEAVFEKEGRYSLKLFLEDEAGHRLSEKEKTLCRDFAIDRTPPICVIDPIKVTEKGFQVQTICEDNIDFAKILLYKNGSLYKESKNQKSSWEISFDHGEKWQLKIFDTAGNKEVRYLLKEELEKEGFDKACVDKYLAMFEEITNDVQGVRYVKEKLEGVLDPEYADGLELIMNSVDAVKAADFKIAFDPTLVRGMSYYTGPIFEISMDEFGGSVGGGGRYDEMIGKFTGNNTCACGFSIGFERIIMLLMERGFQIPQIGTKKALLIEKNMPAEGMMKVLKQAEEDRKNGSVVTIAVMKKNKKFQKEQLKEEGYEEIVEFFADRM